MTAWGAVSGSLDHLVTTFREIEDVFVIDGQPLAWPADPDLLVVGYSEDRKAVTMNVGPAGMSAETVSFDLACYASSWRGDTDPALVRAALDALLAAVETQLAADRTLGGAALDARLEVLDGDQWQTPDGAFAYVAFTVRARTFA